MARQPIKMPAPGVPMPQTPEPKIGLPETPAAPLGAIEDVADASMLAPGEHNELEAILQTSLPETKTSEPLVSQPDIKKQEPVQKSKGPFKVIALRHGFIHRERKVEGDVFYVTEEEFSKAWMKIIG